MLRLPSAGKAFTGSLESARMFRAFEVLLVWNAVDFDINQAYLIGKADSDQQYPVRLPARPIREQYKQADGTETYALITGNLYGLPTTCRIFTNESLANRNKMQQPFEISQSGYDGDGGLARSCQCGMR